MADVPPLRDVLYGVFVEPIVDPATNARRFARFGVTFTMLGVVLGVMAVVASLHLGWELLALYQAFCLPSDFLAVKFAMDDEKDDHPW